MHRACSKVFPWLTPCASWCSFCEFGLARQHFWSPCPATWVTPEHLQASYQGNSPVERAPEKPSSHRAQGLRDKRLGLSQEKWQVSIPLVSATRALGSGMGTRELPEANWTLCVCKRRSARHKSSLSQCNLEGCPSYCWHRTTCFSTAVSKLIQVPLLHS